MNTIIIDNPSIEKNIIHYRYEINGEWSNAFHQMRECTIEYSCDLTNLPIGVAIIPFLANVLPIAWVMDAKIYVKICDFDFFSCIDAVKNGYCNMFPTMNFGGKIFVEMLQKNYFLENKGSVAFFSGGVDAFNTLTCHYKENPTLITLWGSDIKLSDEEGWKRVHKHVIDTASNFDTDFVTVKSEFRTFLNEGFLQKAVMKSGDGWWHGFQHGIGVICHAAPIMYELKKKIVYFASSFTASDKGKVTCASDPTIDNYIKFCGCKVIHDGYEFNRQMKIYNITSFSKNTGIKIPLRVCWESRGGSNCCNCEKCWRTILGIYSAGFNPLDFGFEYKSLSQISRKIYNNKELLKSNRESIYAPIQKAMRENYSLFSVEPSLKWFYRIDINRLGDISLNKKFIIKIYNILRVIKKKLMNWCKNK